MIFGGAGWLMCASIKETYAPVLLQRRAAKLRKETGDDRWWCRYDQKNTSKWMFSVVLPFMKANYSSLQSSRSSKSTFPGLLYSHSLSLSCGFGMLILLYVLISLKELSMWLQIFRCCLPKPSTTNFVSKKANISSR